MFTYMERKPRVEYEGEFYHVIVRGNQRRKIFRDGKKAVRHLFNSFRSAGKRDIFAKLQHPELNRLDAFVSTVIS
jgi:REP element-mobilizing transposase RayT